MTDEKDPKAPQPPVINHDAPAVKPGVPDDRGGPTAHAVPESPGPLAASFPTKPPAPPAPKPLEPAAPKAAEPPLPKASAVSPPKAAEPPGVKAAAASPAPPAASPPPAKSAPAPVKVRGGGSNLLTIILFAALAGGLGYVWDYPKPRDGDDSAALRRQLQAASDQAASAQGSAQALAQQVQSLADRVEKLEKAPAAASAAPTGTADLGDLPRRVDELSAKLDALAARPAAAGQSDAQVSDTSTAPAVAELGSKVTKALDDQKATTDDLATRLAKLEQGAGQSAGVNDRTLRLARVQGALVALESGQKLGDVPGAPPAVTRFATVAPPTEAALRESFPAAAAHARDISRPDVSRRSFFERALTRLQQSVTVRQGNDVLVGDPAAGILADATEKVQAADLPGAVATLQKLQGPAADAMKDWVDQASALLAARAALADLAAHS